MLCKDLKAAGYENEIPLIPLRNMIASLIGGDKLTLKSYPKMMGDLGMIEVVGNNLFRFNWERIEDLEKRVVE